MSSAAAMIGTLRVKINGHTCKGSSSTSSISVASLLNRAQLLKKRICSSRSKFSLLRIDPSSLLSPSLRKTEGLNPKQQRPVPVPKETIHSEKQTGVNANSI